jgi:antitoxin (DNA-binding transcriptional repressor) of toxin-antitoxin stability system
MVMSTITVQEIQDDLSGFLRRVEAGEAFLLVQGDRPLAEVRPMQPAATQPRPFGLSAGQFKVPDDFDQPLPDDILKDFEAQ